MAHQVTFTAPVGVTSVVVEFWAKGGSGAAGSPGNGTGGPGGGGGEYTRTKLTVVPGNNYTVQVPVIADGNADCFFTSALVAGAIGGLPPAGINGGVGGTGGVSDFAHAGANGGLTVFADFWTGSGGGGGGGRFGAGVAGSNGSRPPGGAQTPGGVGGDGGDGNDGGDGGGYGPGFSGVAGTCPGGGGGGGPFDAGANNGAGSDAACAIWNDTSGEVGGSGSGFNPAGKTALLTEDCVPAWPVTAKSYAFIM